MQEYLYVQDDISKKKRQGWQVAKLGKEIERVFKIRDRIFELTLNRLDDSAPTILCYIPIKALVTPL